MGRYWYGLDISLKQTGVAVFDIEIMDFVHVSSFNTKKIYATKENKGLFLNGIKLNKILEYVTKIIEQYPPEEAFIERGYSKYKLETQAIFKTHGVFNCVLWKVPQTYYPPKSIKLAVGFSGTAKKEKLKEEIEKRFPNLIMNNDDESDACSCVITALIERGLIEWKKPLKVVKSTKTKKSKKKDDKCK